MMRFLVCLALVGVVAAQTWKQNQQPFQTRNTQGNSRTQGKFVWDLLKVPLTPPEVAALQNLRGAAAYPTYSYDNLPRTSFSCASKAQPGFYADVDAQCQVWHRCDQSGNQTDFICVNSTLFNQITLVCDSWYNVDCGQALDVENFANSRLYTNLPLFDTPPADYVAPSQLILLQNQGVSQQVQGQQQQGGRGQSQQQQGGRGQSGQSQQSGQSSQSGQSQQQGGQQQSQQNAQGRMMSGNQGSMSAMNGNMGTLNVQSSASSSDQNTQQADQSADQTQQ